MSDTVACQNCGREITPGDKFCPGCGTAVTDPEDTLTRQFPSDPGTNPTECATCGRTLGPDDQFCPKCGAAGPDAVTVVSHSSLRNSQAAHLIDLTRGEYDIIQRLGHGAMGAVYLARDIALSRRVAIKVIAPNLLADETMVSRFRLEAQTVASLRHPNIVDVYAVRQAEDLHFFVMEFIDGPTLHSIIKQQAPLDIDVVQGILFQVGSALSYAHRTGQGVIHRDVKPANIMVDYEGDAFVTDFGISKVAEVQSGLTQTGATIGTPEYMSPEQCMGAKLTGASDQYALGIVAYEMLCGRTPFSGSHYSIMMAHTQERPDAIPELRPDCPPEIARAVERMLAKQPEERWPDLDQAVTALGGEHLGYQHPTRAKIVTLAQTTKTAHVKGLDTSSPLSPVASNESGADTATSVTVTGLPSWIEPGDTFSLEADIRGAAEISLTGLDVEWRSTDPSIARVEAGQVEAVRSGSASITAMVGDVASSVLVTVAEPAPASVAVKPASVTMHEGGRITLGARVLDRRDRPLETGVGWRSSDESVVTVSESGDVVAVGPGAATVTAESESVTGSAQIVVEAAPTVADRTVMAPRTPGAPSVTPSQPELTRPAASVGRNESSTPSPKPTAPPRSGPSTPPRAKPATPPRKRRSPAAVIGTLVVILGIGGAGYWAITRPSGPATDTSQGDVIGAGAAGGADPAPAAADSGQNGETQVAGAADNGQPEDTEAQTTRAPATETVAEIESPAEETDPSQEEAAPPQQPGPSQEPRPTPPPDDPPAEDPEPTPAPVAGAVAVEVPGTSMEYASTQMAAARVFSTGGTPMAAGSYTLSWRSNDPRVLAVDNRGTVSAVGPGAAWLVASADGVRDSVQIAVTVAVEIEEGDFTLEEGASRTLSATGRGAQGATLDASPTWRSSDAGVASVAERTGQVTAVAPGSARIIASVAGFEDAVTVTVEAETPDPPTADVVRVEVEGYVALLSDGDADAVNALWGGGSEELREELFELMDRNDFSARLETMGDPTLQGDAVRVTFRVVGEYRNFAGARRDEPVDFQAELGASTGQWRLTSATATSIGG